MSRAKGRKNVHPVPHPCNCESLDCRHAHMSVPAGEQSAMWIGPVCDDCADTHMQPYLLHGSDAERIRKEVHDYETLHATRFPAKAREAYSLSARRG